ncbi:tetratricopeptide repeat-containing sensor histidine kinase [Flavobacterium phycosphaerae]|uniref:tetratricopeptide repeat-containing sensor histidine kinase n=1 Tax=Flavobacterium phycosphaerae TaxID=2697515 RepID=UPI00138A5848|nr:histidine kinase [Flavobacterium phycosphaerae]
MFKFTAISQLLLVFMFLGITVCTAQNSNIDSLKQVINSRANDTSKIRAFSLLLINISNTSKEYEYYNEKMKATALHSINDKKSNEAIKEKAYDALAVYYVNKAYQTMQTDYLVTIKNLHKSLEYFNPKYFVSDKYIGGRAYVLMSLGVMYNKIGNTKQSINNYFEALHIFEKEKHKSSISYALQSIANLYNEQKKYNEALQYYIKAYNIYYKTEELSFQDNVQKVLLFISIAKCQQELNHCDSSANYLNRGLALALQLNDKDVLSEIYFNLGQNAEKCNNNLDSALAEYRKSLLNSSLPENNAKSFIAIGSVLGKQKKNVEAEINLKNGLTFAQKINHLEFQKQALENLYRLYKQQKQFAKAIEIGESYAMIKDSIKKEENDNTLSKKQLQYEYETKQSQLKLQQERKLNAVKLANQKKNAFKNNLLIGLSFVLFLFFAIGYFLNKSNKQKQAIANFEKNELNQKLLLSQMNPHFIFNSIDNIQSLIFNKQDKEAVNYLTKFSKLTRQILENSNENYISLSEELTMIDNYLVIQQLLYNNKFDFDIEVDETLDSESILLPPMLTQPFIENAIKHGLKNTIEKGQINISFKFENEKLLFEITDSGVGFSHEETVNHKSLAMKITKERLVNISKKTDFEVQTENRLDDQKNIIGAKVFFEIPYIYEN